MTVDDGPDSGNAGGSWVRLATDFTADADLVTRSVGVHGGIPGFGWVVPSGKWLSLCATVQGWRPFSDQPWSMLLTGMKMAQSGDESQQRNRAESVCTFNRCDSGR